MSAPYEVIIGLEVHVQLDTKTKLFCRCSTEFGAEPNTHVCPVCLGMPGALPVMNRRAYDLGLKVGLALNCEIPKFTKWDRKQYYYPDLPKGYQTSQFDQPMTENGWLAIRDSKDRFEPKKVGVTRAHLEEDAGKSMHDEAAGRADSRIDLNRTGTPLLEIVSEPDMRSAAEARAYLTELKLLLTYLEVSDCNMQEGSLRVDANVNLHVPKGGDKIATPIVEIKNVNSFSAVEAAIEYEVHRQFDEWEDTGKTIKDAPKRTFGWDDQAEVTKPQREKEDSADYRYFPCPDLCPVTVTDEQLEEVRNSLGELPAQIRERLQSEFSLSEYDADVIVNKGREVVEYFETVAKESGDNKKASNWLTQSVFATMGEKGDNLESIADFPVPATELAALIKQIVGGQLDNSTAKRVFAEMCEKRSTVEEATKSLGIEQVDDSALEALCKELLEANPHVIDDVKAGKVKAVGALIGKAKQKNPNVNPNQFRELCIKIIEAM